MINSISTAWFDGGADTVVVRGDTILEKPKDRLLGTVHEHPPTTPIYAGGQLENAI